MILQALYDYAQRKGDSLPEDGFENLEIKYLIKIREDGSLADLVSTVENKKGHIYRGIPEHAERSSNIKASLLADNVEYVLTDEKKREAFIEEIEGLPDDIKETKEIKAVISFYRGNRNNGLDKIPSCALWEECRKAKDRISFVLQGKPEIIPQLACIREFQRKRVAEKNEGAAGSSAKAVCLITGKNEVIASIHPATPVPGGKSNAKFVGFQVNSGYDSYGKEQALNAPVSRKAVSAYTRALNYLIKSKENRFFIGGDTVVFWAEKPEAAFFESVPLACFGRDFDDPDRSVKDIKTLFSAPFTAKLEEVDSDFYVLGLSPNAARISVRFWETGKVEKFAERIKQHFFDFEIVRRPQDFEFLNLWQILSSVVLKSKKEKENIPPCLSGSMVQSILKGIPYPATLQQQCIRRIRAEQKVTRARAAILKAYINRWNRYKNRNEEVSVSLDRNCLNKGYLLGRLFAAFEKVQEDTHPGLNATITDRYYGSASTNPATVFPQLIRLNRYHMGSYGYDKAGLKVVREKEIGEIMNGLDSFPNHLNLNEQSYFAVGYYHERQSFYKSSSDTKEQTKGEN